MSQLKLSCCRVIFFLMVQHGQCVGSHGKCQHGGDGRRGECDQVKDVCQKWSLTTWKKVFAERLERLESNWVITDPDLVAYVLTFKILSNGHSRALGMKLVLNSSISSTVSENFPVFLILLHFIYTKH